MLTLRRAVELLAGISGRSDEPYSRVENQERKVKGDEEEPEREARAGTFKKEKMERKSDRSSCSLEFCRRE
jgi:hypothetical protein